MEGNISISFHKSLNITYGLDIDGTSILFRMSLNIIYGLMIDVQK